MWPCHQFTSTSVEFLVKTPTKRRYRYKEVWQKAYGSAQLSFGKENFQDRIRKLWKPWWWLWKIRRRELSFISFSRSCRKGKDLSMSLTKKLKSEPLHLILLNWINDSMMILSVWLVPVKSFLEENETTIRGGILQWIAEYTSLATGFNK